MRLEQLKTRKFARHPAASAGARKAVKRTRFEGAWPQQQVDMNKNMATRTQTSQRSLMRLTRMSVASLFPSPSLFLVSLRFSRPGAQLLAVDGPCLCRARRERCCRLLARNPPSRNGRRARTASPCSSADQALFHVNLLFVAR